MINDKIKVIVLIVILVIAILIIRNVVIENQSTSENNIETTVAEIKYDEGNGVYYIEDENGMVLHEGYSEYELYIYQIDPDYNPQNPDTPEEYVEYTE